MKLSNVPIVGDIYEAIKERPFVSALVALVTLEVFDVIDVL